jgi:hypothetical protein
MNGQVTDLILHLAVVGHNWNSSAERALVRQPELKTVSSSTLVLLTVSAQLVLLPRWAGSPMKLGEKCALQGTVKGHTLRVTLKRP